MSGKKNAAISLNNFRNMAETTLSRKNEDKTAGKLDHFEGLRGVCCTIVIVDHCINQFAPWFRHNGPDTPIIQRTIANSPLNIVYSGIPQVYIFFLMSAFVLSLGYFKYGSDYLPKACLKRIPRLVLPCAFAGLFFFICTELMEVLGRPVDGAVLPRFIAEATYFAPFLGNVTFNGPLWTISWEIYGSFLVFAVLALFGSTHLFPFICLALAAWYFETNYLPFLVGMATCFVITKHATSALNKIPRSVRVSIFSGLLAVSFVLMSYPYKRDSIVIPAHLEAISWSGNWQLDYRNNVMIGSILVFLVACLWDSAQAVLRTKTLVFLGRISFSAYLIHLPIIWLSDLFLPPAAVGDLVSGMLKSAIAIVLTLFCAIIFERYVDRRSIAVSSEFSNWGVRKARSC